MDFPFPINRLATGPDFLTRGAEAEALASNMEYGRHTLLFDAKKTGKHTLVRNALDILDKKGFEYTLVYADLFKSRTKESLLENYTHAVRDAFYGSSEGAFNEHIDKSAGKREILTVPETIAGETGAHVIVWLDEFQNVLNFDDPDSTLKLLEQSILNQTSVTYVFMGSKINAMKYLLEHLGSFFNFCDRIILPPLNEDDVIYQINRVFQRVGRVITREQEKQIYDYSGGNPWLIWQISNLCFNLTRGYVTDSVLQEAVRTMLTSHEMEFHDIIDSLSNYQLGLLKAVFDGEIRLNSQEVIDRYRLSSSANVHRLKEALLKKEIITFDDEYRPMIIDPLFHLWLRTCYFTE